MCRNDEDILGRFLCIQRAEGYVLNGSYGGQDLCPGDAYRFKSRSFYLERVLGIGLNFVFRIQAVV